MSGVLFENSIVCLVVLLFVVFLLPVVGGLPVFLFIRCGLFYHCQIFCLVLGQIFLIRIHLAFWVGLFLFGEFDSGSGRTLAACLTHASRTVRPFGVHEWRTGE